MMVDELNVAARKADKRHVSGRGPSRGVERFQMANGVPTKGSLITLCSLTSSIGK